MKKRILCLSLLLAGALLALPLAAGAAPAEGPVLAADGGSFTYQGKTVTLGKRALYVDGRLSDEQAAKFDYVYNSFPEAVAHLTDGTEAEPMELYLAPYVYWLHDPHAPEAQNMTGDYQLEIACENLHITGLTDDPQNVVVAANFGHDVGFMGSNYTMFHITGDGLTLKDLTFGDYCNVDLIYPADPSLNMPMRAPGNVTQGQIGVYDGDRLFAQNVRFISRLNMMPFNNAQRALYIDCHLECTDDALNGSAQAVYLNCEFEFYSSKPWYTSAGVTLLDCDMKIAPINADANTQVATQYLAKSAGPFTVIDSSFVSDIPSATIGWSDVFDETFKSYYSHVDFNGAPITFDGGARPGAGVDLTGKDALRAFKLSDGTYNVYNLLRGEDDWDPLGQKHAVTAAGAAVLPTFMRAYIITGDDTAPVSATMVSGGEDASLTLGYTLTGPKSVDYNAASQATWEVADSDRQYVKLTPNPDGTCTVEGVNTTEETALVLVTAKDASGLEAAVALTVRPSVLPAPIFAQAPAIALNTDGTASVSYTYAPGSLGDRPDNARLTWYVCGDAQGTDPIPVAVGRGDTPLNTIPLTQAMAGKHLMVTVEPKHRRSDYGAAVTAISPAPVAVQNAPTFDGTLSVDLATLPTATQSQVLPGFWTVDSVKPADAIPETGSFPGGWTAECDGTSKWAYGTGVKNGTAGVTGLYNTDRGARLMYTPLEAMDREMDLAVTLAPGKTAGQGFGSKNQYMDFMVKYDPASHTGYGLRVYRISASTCGFVLVAHTADGNSQLLTQPAESGIFLTETTIHVWTQGEKVNAFVYSSAAPLDEVFLSAYVPGLSALTDSGVDINHTGTAGDNAVYLTSITVRWPERHPLPATDLDPAAYYYDAAIWALENSYMAVNGQGAFEPDRPCAWNEVFGVREDDGIHAGATCSRADVLTHFWTTCDKPQPTMTEHPFTDIPAGADYETALLWAVEKGVTTGTTPTTFEPDRPCTRGELAVFLSRLFFHGGAGSD